MEIKEGTVFNTPFEKGCVAVSSPDQFGGFVATDSDGVECSYSVAMVCGYGHKNHQHFSHECEIYQAPTH